MTTTMRMLVISFTTALRNWVAVLRESVETLKQ